jgi:hypothetical protein
MKWMDGFVALRLAPAGASRAAGQRPGLPFARLLSALRLRPRRALSSAEAGPVFVPMTRICKQIPAATGIIPVLIAQHCPVLIAPRQRAFVPTHYSTGQTHLKDF